MVEEIVHFARIMMKPSRLRHTVMVRDCAIALAQIHGLNPRRVEIMAMAHDLFRDVDPLKLLKISEIWGLDVEEIERENPVLLHGKVSAEFLRRRFGVKDEGVLLAVAYHTSGHPDLDEEGRALVIADTVSYDREFECAEELREIARRDLNRAFREVIRNRIEYALKTGRYVLEMSARTWNSLVRRYGR